MLGKRLRALRKARGLTQQELGELLGVSTSAVGMYEQGRRAPDHRTLAELCRLFQVPADYFLLEEVQPAQAQGPSEGPTELSQLLEGFRRKLMDQEGLMFNGVPLTAEDVRMVMDAVEVGARVAVSRLAGQGKKLP